jgi:acetyl-CoA carboxylase biotin carboxyl carrier protein
MDIRKIKKLIDLIEESGISEIEIKEGEESVRISRHSGQATTLMMPPSAATYPSLIPSNPTPTWETPDSNEPEPPQGYVLKAPMVGTFYRATAPGAKPLVEVGQHIQIGDAVCIIEAMKMFNQIEADHAGVVTQILAQDGQPVEYDQPLLVVE